MEKHGYLYFKRLLPNCEIAKIRHQILTECELAGWLSNEAKENSAKIKPSSSCEPPDESYYTVYNNVISLEALNLLAHKAPILNLMRILLRDNVVLVRPSKLARLVFPQSQGMQTPAHQDFPHEQGTIDAYTCWIPFGDCPRELGGVEVWPGSHRQGILDHGFMPGTGGLGINTESLGATWASTNMEIGDVLIFHSLTVHRALRNTTPDQLRLSLDCRYQSIADPVTEYILSPSGGQLDWNEVYREWRSTTYQYYWHRLNLSIVPYDFSYYEKRDREVLAQASAGNPRARKALITIIKRCSDPNKVSVARKALKELDATISSAGNQS